MGTPPASTVYARATALDLTGHPPDLQQGLVLLLADGKRSLARLCAASPLPDDLTLTLVDELVRAGHLEERIEGPAAEPSYLSCRLFECDQEAPPEEVERATATLTGEIELRTITGESQESYLLSRIDGVATVRDLQRMTGMPMPLVLRRLAKHHDLGTLTFPADFLQAWLVPAADAGPAELISHLADAAAVADPLRRTRVSLPAHGMPGSLAPDELLVTSAVGGGTRVKEVLLRGHREAGEVLQTLLELFRRGEVVFEPPPRDAAPAPPPPDVPPLGHAERRQPTLLDDYSHARAERRHTTADFLTLPEELFRGEDEDDYEEQWQAVPHQGDVADVEMPQILASIYERSLTGILYVRRGGDHQLVWFLLGQPVAATSTEADDGLGSLLWNSGQLDKEVYLSLQRECARQPEEPEWKVLHGLFVLVPDVIEAARRNQVVHIVARLHRARIGQYLFVGKRRLQSDLKLLSADVERIRAVVAGERPAMTPPEEPETPEEEPGFEPTLSAFTPAPPEDEPEPETEPGPQTPSPPAKDKRVVPLNVAEWLNEHFDRYVIVPPEVLDEVASLRVGERERRLLDAMAENRHRLREALAMSSLGRVKTFRFVAALWAQRYVEFADEVDDEDEAVRDLASLNRTLVRMETGDLFHALGCHPSATHKELVRAHKQEKARFVPERFFDREPEFQRSIARINVVLDRAHRQLRDTPGRRRYRLEHFGEARLRTFAEVQAKKAEVFLFFKQDHGTAYDLYESAWDLVPNNALYLALLGYCHFRCHPGDEQERERGVHMVARATDMGGDARVLLVAAMLERDQNNPAHKQRLLARARKLVPDRDEFRKLLKSFRLLDGD